MIPRRCSGELYRVLEVQKDASSNEIKKAYHKMALQFHPDKTGGTTTEKFKLIQEAHSILHDADQRKRYDTFGRSGMKQMESMGIPPISAGMLRLCGLLCSIAFLLLLIFNILVVVKLDDGMSGNWGAVWTPMWIVCAISLISVGPLLRSVIATPSVPMVTTLLQCILFPVCNIVFVLGAEGHVEWKHVIIPFFISYAVEMLRSADGLRFEKFQALYTAMGGTEEITSHSPVYVRAVFSELVKSGTTLATLALLASTFSGVYPGLSYWIVMAPVLSRLAFFFLVDVIVVMAAAQDCKSRVFALMGTLLGYFPAVYTVCFVTAKVQAEVNHAKTYNPTAAACSAFTFAVLALGVLCSCFLTCCADNFIPATEGPITPEDGEARADPDEVQEPYQNMTAGDQA